MKRIILLFLFGLILSIQLFAQSITILPGNGKDELCAEDPWVLIIDDEFDGNMLDTILWSACEGIPRDLTFKKQKAYHKPSNIVVEDGLLKIISKRDTLINQSYWSPDGLEVSDFYYSTGEIWSKLMMSYGKYEARVRIPKGKGLWPAFWLYGDGSDNGEIDIFEFWNEHPKKYKESKLSTIQHMTVHYDVDTTDNIVNISSELNESEDMSQDFHIYTLIYTPSYIKWEVDGILVREYNRFYDQLGRTLNCSTPDNQIYIKRLLFPVKPLHVIFNTAIQYGNHPSENKFTYDQTPDENTVFPAVMEVDWFRYYTSADHNRVTSEYINDYWTSQPNVRNVIAGKFIEIDTINVDSTLHLQLLGRNEVRILPEFYAKQGSCFSASIIQNEQLQLQKSLNEKSAQYGSESKTLNLLFEQEKTDNIVSETDTIQEEISIFPNPTSGIVNIRNVPSYWNTFNYCIYTEAGERVFCNTITQNHDFSIVLPKNKGDYIFVIFNPITFESQYFKIIKQ